jgi:putative endonuclease
MRAKDAVGRFGEDVAAQHLVRTGLVVLERNWRCSLGEIDIVARDGDTLVVCEVKTRRGLRFGSPLEAVTETKARRLRQLAAEWVRVHEVRPALVRIDVVGVLAAADGPMRVEHVRGAV